MRRNVAVVDAAVEDELLEDEEEHRRERLKWNGWGWQEKSFDLHGGEKHLWAFLQSHMGLSALPPTPAATIEDLALAPWS